MVVKRLETSPSRAVIAKSKCKGINKMRGYKREWNRNVAGICMHTGNRMEWAGLGFVDVKLDE